MQTQIYCAATKWGEHSFYLITESGEYFLFKQNYRKGVHKYFRDGVRLEDIYDYSKAKGNPAIIHTFEKLPSRIRYIENEYGIVVLEQTRRKQKIINSSGKLSA